MKGNILLTGFEPFGGSDVNPSILVCRNLEGTEINDYKLVVEEVPLRYEEVQPTLIDAIRKHEPKAVISTGQSGAPHLSIERVAINITHARIPYNCGFQPKDKTIIEGGPAAYFTRLPYRETLEALKEAKIPAHLSNSAGTFGCNHIFYLLMNYVKENGLDIPAGFIHVPPLPEQVLEKRTASMTVDLITDGLRVAAETVVQTLQ